MQGTYTVLLNCSRRMTTRIGRLGRFKLPEGYYVYTGSGLGVGAASLEGRIERHKRRSKTLRWHVDYLTSNENWNFAGAVYVVSKRRLECRINCLICCSLHALPIIPKFGSSDCNCLTHLLRFDGVLKCEELLKALDLLCVRFGSPAWVHAET